MKITDTSPSPKIAIIGCLHGDETFGQSALEHFANTPRLRLILANEEALHANVRFIDEDVNRCFPGDPDGNHEQRLAHKLLPLVRDMDYVLDIHTTTSDIQVTPIVPHLDPYIRHVLNACSSAEVVQMGKRLVTHSLIGNVRHGVSLEFNKTYATTPAAMKEVKQIVQALLSGRHRQAQYRRLFRTVKLISLRDQLPPSAHNFHYVPELDLYPFLLHEKSYITHQGFAAKRYAEVMI